MPNILANCKRYFLVFAAMLLVLLTSCAVKTSIKNLAGIPTKTERGVPKGNQNFSTNTLEKCAQFDASDTQIVQKVSFNANDLLPSIPHVTDVHDIHIWTIDGEYSVFTSHIVVPPSSSSEVFNSVRHGALDILKKFHVQHPTIQVETSTDTCLLKNC